MSKTKRMLRVAIVAAQLFALPALAQAPAAVEVKGQSGKIKLEEVVSGHLTELNGRYKLRVTETTYEPGGTIGAHHHAGPGIRCLTAGELTYVQPDRTTIYRAGDCFYESGDITHSAANKTDKPVVLLNFEVLPASWSKGSSIPVPK